MTTKGATMSSKKYRRFAVLALRRCQVSFARRYSIFAVLSCAVPILQAQSGGGYEFTRSTIDSGGVMRSTGGGFELSGTIGQADAGNMIGGNFGLTGGFWFAISVGDCDDDGLVGEGDIRGVADCADGPGSPFAPAVCVCSDFDRDGDIDLRDFAAMQLQFAGR